MRIGADRGQLGPFGVHGRVVVRAVIDESGRLEPASISLVTSSSSAFEAGGPGGLAAAALSSGASGSQPVPALIELRFDIRPEGLDWSGTRSRRRDHPLAGGGAIRGALGRDTRGVEPRLGPPSW